MGNQGTIGSREMQDRPYTSEQALNVRNQLRMQAQTLNPGAFKEKTYAPSAGKEPCALHRNMLACGHVVALPFPPEVKLSLACWVLKGLMGCLFIWVSGC